MKIIHGARKELRGGLVTAARTVFGADDEHLVHSNMKRVGVESVDDLVDKRKDKGVHLGVKRAPAAAVNIGVLRELARRFIELGMSAQQSERMLAPRLMTQAINLRNEPNALSPCHLRQFTSLRPGDISLRPNLW